MERVHSLQGDFFISAILASVIIAGLSLLSAVALFSFDFYVGKSDIALLVGVFTSVLSVILTVLTILYAFESNLSKNAAVQELKSAGKFAEIYCRFTDSTVGIFFSLLVLVVSFFFYSILIMRVSFFLYWVVVTITMFSFIRTWRCFYLFRLLQDAADRLSKI